MKVTATPLETNIAKFTGPFHDPIPLITMSIQLSQDDYEQIKCIDKSNLEVTISEKNNQPTDYEKLKSLLVKFGVGIEEDESSDTPKVRVIKCCEGSKKVHGYMGFFAVFYFDDEGNFIKIGVYEE